MSDIDNAIEMVKRVKREQTEQSKKAIKTCSDGYEIRLETIGMQWACDMILQGLALIKSESGI